MQRRTGLTLVEVLVAIFIMGIGLIALLTLFPIGILRMAQAIRNEKTALAASVATANANIHNVRNDSQVVSFPGTAFEAAISDVFANPYPNIVPGPGPGRPTADSMGESYPIFVDPVGYYLGQTTAQDWVGATPGYLRRRPHSVVPNNAQRDLNIYRWFMMWDDVIFDSVFDPSMSPIVTRPGTPKVIANNAAANPPLTIQRDPRYSWAYLLRRPQTSDRSIVDCTVVVFDKRATLALTETVYSQSTTNAAYFDTTKNTITINVNGITPPNVRAGDWICDTTFFTPSATTGSCHGTFYRVVGVDAIMIGADPCVRFEVQTPIRGFTASEGIFTTAYDSTYGGYKGTAIYMEGVAEVFEKGPVRVQ